ncbi:MAG: hypothetical protein JWN33_524 [Candidatus Saccharibacteria bacterium]|nr:hypothetical protein [Candidatus Saccharibacteria bacterium]
MNYEKFLKDSSDKYPFSRKVATLAIAVPLALNLSGCTTAETPKPTISSTPYDTDIDPRYDKECAIVPDEVIDETEDVYAETWSKSEIMGGSDSVDDYLKAQKEKKKSVANELGLTVYDYRSEMADLSVDLYADTSVISAETYFEHSEEFLSRYGVSIVFSSAEVSNTELAVPTSSKPYSYESLVSENSLETKRVLYSLISSVGDLPVELVQAMGLQRIILTDTVSSDVAGFVVPDQLENNTVYIDYKTGSGTVLVHEMFHLWDHQQCGPIGAMRDEQYDEINPPPAEGKFNFYADTQGYYGDDEAFKLKNDQGLMTDIQFASTEAEKAEIQSKIDEIDSRVAAANEYGLTNIVEDKASLGQDLIGNWNRWTVESSESPILQEKAVLLMARLYEQSPELVEYLARAGQGSIQDTNVFAEQ